MPSPRAKGIHRGGCVTRPRTGSGGSVIRPQSSLAVVGVSPTRKLFERKNLMYQFWKWKTFWAAIAAIATAIGAHAAGEMSLAQLLQIIATSLLAVFLRHGIAKTDVHL